MPGEQGTSAAGLRCCGSARAWFQGEAEPRSNFAIRRQVDLTNFTGSGKIIKQSSQPTVCNKAYKADIFSCHTKAEMYV